MTNKYIYVLALINLISPVVFGGIKFPEEVQEHVNMLHSTCVEETGVSEENIEKARSGDFVDDEKLKCYMMCTMAQMACVTEDGIIDVEATVGMVPGEFQDFLGPTIRKCDTQKGTSPCDNVWLTHKCYFEDSPTGYFLI